MFAPPHYFIYLINLPGTLEAGAVEDPAPHVQPLQDKHRLGADAAGVGAAANGRDLATPTARQPAPLRQVGVRTRRLGHRADAPHPVLNGLAVESLVKSNSNLRNI
jgi:hypothetical protein